MGQALIIYVIGPSGYVYMYVITQDAKTVVEEAAKKILSKDSPAAV